MSTIRAKDLPKWREGLANRKKLHEASTFCQNKPFDELTPEEKDQLLCEVAVRLGLCKPVGG